MACAALTKLIEAEQRVGVPLSIGLEPRPERLPAGFEPTVEGCFAFCKLIIESTRHVAAAYKANLAFFEALGADGWRLLHRVREAAPGDALFIADAKRGDIGSSAERYAAALYDSLDADATTVNPLMGRDAVEPFLAYADRLSYGLVLTSNPGAADFLEPEGLHLRIALRLLEWSAAGNVGFVVGATQLEGMRSVREVAPATPFLVPGVGAQGGAIADAAKAGRAAKTGAGSGLLFHVTRSVLPGPGEASDPAESIHSKAEAIAAQLRAARPVEADHHA